MKRSLAFALVLLVLAAGGAQAFCHGFSMYILQETPAGYSSHYGNCNLNPEPGVPARLHFFVNCEIGSDLLSHLEVRYPDWPVDPTAEQGRMEFIWTADAVSGSLREGLVLDWSAPRAQERITCEDGYVYVYRLGSVELESLGTDWLSEPLTVHAGEPWQANFWVNHWGDLYFLGDHEFNFNVLFPFCTLYCSDQPPSCFARHFEPPLGALVPRAIVPFSFEVFYFDCMAYMNYGYEGTVSVYGESLLAFDGWFHGEHSVDIDFSVYAPGTVVPVRIDASAGASYTMNFVVDETATAPSSLSAIKARY